MVTRPKAQSDRPRAVLKMGTKMTEQTDETNAPADLQTATANLIRLQQQSIRMKKKHPTPMRVHPMG